MAASPKHEIAGEVDQKPDRVDESSSASIEKDASVARSSDRAPDGSPKASRLVCLFCPGAALMEIWRRERHSIG